MIIIYICDDFELILQPESLILSPILEFLSLFKYLEVTGTLDSQKVRVGWAELQIKGLLGAWDPEAIR